LVDAEEGNRERPDRTVNVAVITDEGRFESSGSEAEGITLDLSAEGAR
jgi:hypothetical protein